jgi:hypothetical protein
LRFNRPKQRDAYDYNSEEEEPQTTIFVRPKTKSSMASEKKTKSSMASETKNSNSTNALTN